MTVLDVFLMLIVVVLIFLVSMQGLLRSLIVALAFYVVTFVVGAVALSYTSITSALSDLTATIGLSWPQSLNYQAIVFLGLGMPMFIAIWFLTSLVLGDVDMTSVRVLDALLAFLVGIVLALVIASILCNVWGILVRTPWREYQTWQRLYTAYKSSVFRPHLQTILAWYRRTLFFFQITRMPEFLIPQL